MAPRRILELEELGQRILPSSIPLSLPSTVSADALIATHHPHPQHPLPGQGSGTYTRTSLNPDTGVSYTVQGQAELANLGHVTMDGSVHGLGFVASGRATGTLTFANDNGSVTLDLRGPVQQGFAPVPADWTYQVTAATGDYQTLKGETGSLRLTFRPDPVRSGFSWAFQVTLIVDGGSPLPGSGLDGLVVIGPIVGAERLGVPNTRPLAGAVVEIQTADGSTEVTRVVTDNHGLFHVSLAPGTYRLVPLPLQPGSAPVYQEAPPTPQTVIVRAGEETDVTVAYFSGIL